MSKALRILVFTWLLMAALAGAATTALGDPTPCVMGCEDPH